MMLQARVLPLETFSLIKSYEFGRTIECHINDPIRSRVHAIAIPAICLFGEIIKFFIDLVRITDILIQSTIQRKIETGNFHSGVMHLSEHCRNITGIVFGFFFGLRSPQAARETFLTVEAKKLTMKLDPQLAARLYSLGYGIAKFFDKHNIDYRMCSGTVLGAIRHKGIIPWDDDIDLMLHPTSHDRLRQLVEDGTFKQETGLEIKWQPLTGGWQCFHSDGLKGEGLLTGFGIPFVDIFCTTLDEQQRIYFEDIKMRAISANEYYTSTEWNEEATEYEFGPIKLKGVKDSKPFIYRAFNEDSLNFAYQTMHHDELSKMFGNPFNLIGHYQKLTHYGLPRRTYLANKAAINYDVATFNADIKEIDRHFNKKQ